MYQGTWKGSAIENELVQFEVMTPHIKNPNDIVKY